MTRREGMERIYPKHKIYSGEKKAIERLDELIAAKPHTPAGTMTDEYAAWEDEVGDWAYDNLYFIRGVIARYEELSAELRGIV